MKNLAPKCDDQNGRKQNSASFISLGLNSNKIDMNSHDVCCELNLLNADIESMMVHGFNTEVIYAF